MTYFVLVLTMLVFSSLNGASETKLRRRNSIAIPQGITKNRTMPLDTLYESPRRHSIFGSSQDLESIDFSLLPSKSLGELKSDVEALTPRLPISSGKSEEDLLLAMITFDDMLQQIESISPTDYNLEAKLVKISKKLRVKFFNNPSDPETLLWSTRLAILILEKTKRERYLYPYRGSFLEEISSIAQSIFDKYYKGKGNKDGDKNRTTLLSRIAHIYSELIQNATSLEEAKNVAMILLEDADTAVATSALGLLNTLVSAFDAERKRYYKATGKYMKLAKEAFGIVEKAIHSSSEKLGVSKAYGLLTLVESDYKAGKTPSFREEKLLQTGVWEYLIAIKIAEKLVNTGTENFDDAATLCRKLSIGGNEFTHKASASLVEEVLTAMLRKPLEITREQKTITYRTAIKLFLTYHQSKAAFANPILVSALKTLINLAKLYYNLPNMVDFAKRAYVMNTVNVKVLGLGLFYQLLDSYNSILQDREEAPPKQLFEEASYAAQDALLKPRISTIFYKIAKGTLDIIISIAKASWSWNSETMKIFSLELFYLMLSSYKIVVEELGKRLQEAKALQLSLASRGAFTAPHTNQLMPSAETSAADKDVKYLDQKVDELSDGDYRKLKTSATEAAKKIIEKERKGTTVYSLAEKILTW